MLVALTPIALLAYALLALLASAIAYRFRRLLLGGIPHISAEAMGLYRIVFGAALFWLMANLLRLPDTSAPGGSASEAALWDPWPWVEYLATHWHVRDALQIATLVAIGCFTLGLRARVAYVLVAAGFVVRLLVAQEYGVGSHAWVLLPLVLAPLVLVPWSDGLSVDNFIRRRRRRPPRGRGPGPHYGLAVWFPGFVLGCVWAAAAGTKIRKTDWEWVTSGAVRYHWAEDHLSAPLSWGAWVATHHDLAVLFSAAAVAIEALFITHVLFRSEWIRLAYGFLALSLLAGFYAFQGVFWHAWWIPLLAFLPWEAIVRFAKRQAGRDSPSALSARPSSAPARWYAAVAVIVAVIGVQQLAISRADVEQMPFFSNYPMYSSTWESPDAFNEIVAPTKFYTYEYEDVDGGGTQPTDITTRVKALRVDSALRDATTWRFRYPGEPLDPSTQAAVAKARASYEQRFGVPLRRVRVTSHARVFDFNDGRLRAAHAAPPVMIDLRTLRVS